MRELVFVAVVLAAASRIAGGSDAVSRAYTVVGPPALVLNEAVSRAVTVVGPNIPAVHEAVSRAFTITTCTWDYDRDGVVGVIDFLALLLAWGPAPGGSPFDFNGDGTVDANDFLALLQHWGSCP